MLFSVYLVTILANLESVNTRVTGGAEFIPGLTPTGCGNKRGSVMNGQSVRLKLPAAGDVTIRGIWQSGNGPVKSAPEFTIQGPAGAAPAPSPTGGGGGGAGDPCAGADITGDGTVNVEDLLNLLAAYSTDASGDTNGDGVTNVEDLLALLAAYGKSGCGGGGAPKIVTISTSHCAPMSMVATALEGRVSDNTSFGRPKRLQFSKVFVWCRWGTAS